MEHVNNITQINSPFSRLTGAGASSSAASSELQSECSICLDRKPDIILPCAHTYCTPCIEQW